MSGGFPRIALDGLRKAYASRRVLQGVDLAVSSGEVLTLMGPSGAGKTTLIRIVAGLESADAGGISLDGREIGDWPAHRRRLGVVFQESSLFRRLSVEENIGFGPRMQRLPKVELSGVVDEWLERLGLQARRRDFPGQLSAGQRQMVALAQVLASRPRALLLDEPFQSVDAETRAQLGQLVRQITREQGLATLFITQDREESLLLGDQVALLHQGTIVQKGTAFEVYHQPASEFVAGFVGASNVLLGRWDGQGSQIGSLHLGPPEHVPRLQPDQPVQLLIRPEDLVLDLMAQLLQTPFYLGRGLIEDVLSVGPLERLRIRLPLWSPRTLDEPIPPDGVPLIATRSRWEATQIELSTGDEVAVGLKDYRLLPHFPIQG